MWDAKLQHMQPTGYEFCQEVTIDFAFGEAPFETVIVVDDVKYTVREGECIPGSPGIWDRIVRIRGWGLGGVWVGFGGR